MVPDENWLASQIPELGGFSGIRSALSTPPIWSDKERSYPPLYRRRLAVRRLSSYFFPGNRHLKLYENLVGQILDGYIGRAQSPIEHEKRVREFADLNARGELLSDDPAGNFGISKPIGIENHSRSSMLLGFPGMGKSLTVEEILRRIPETVRHNDGINFVQVCRIKLDCPHKGSVKALCADFFAELDRILHGGKPTYSKMYAPPRATEEQMMKSMAVVANLHALGILVIDEVQHLSGADGNLLKFLITLINRIGVPVMLVGTVDALGVMADTGRMVRRGIGASSAIWERYSANDNDWIKFIEDIWKYQWTAIETPLTDVLKERIYYHSQGIIDIAVKLFCLSQLRAIRLGERGRAETISVKIIDAVSSEEMALAMPMMNALRSGNAKEIAKFNDLVSITNRAVELVNSNDEGTSIHDQGPAVQKGTVQTTHDENDAEAFSAVFRDLGIAPDVGAEAIAELRTENAEAGFLELAMALKSEAQKWNVAKVEKRSTKSHAGADEISLPLDDVRRLVADGQAVGRIPYLSLCKAGLAGLAAYCVDIKTK